MRKAIIVSLFAVLLVAVCLFAASVKSAYDSMMTDVAEKSETEVQKPDKADDPRLDVSTDGDSDDAGAAKDISEGVTGSLVGKNDDLGPGPDANGVAHPEGVARSDDGDWNDYRDAMDALKAADEATTYDYALDDMGSTGTAQNGWMSIDMATPEQLLATTIDENGNIVPIESNTSLWRELTWKMRLFGELFYQALGFSTKTNFYA